MAELQVTPSFLLWPELDNACASEEDDTKKELATAISMAFRLSYGEWGLRSGMNISILFWDRYADEHKSSGLEGVHDRAVS